MNAEIDISQVTLQTDRLILRSWKESDLEDFYEYAKSGRRRTDGRMAAP